MVDAKPTAVSVKFIEDCAAKDDSFGSHQALADTLARVITEHPQLKVVGLLGSWGSGKSTVLKLLAGQLPPDGVIKTHIFTYDAWLHQSDPPKRAFLERFVDFLEKDADVLNVADWQEQIDILNRRIEDIETRSTPHLTGPGWIVFLSILFLPLGTRFTSSDWYDKMMSSLPSNPAGWVFALGVLLMLLPFLVIGGIKLWGGDSRSLPAILLSKQAPKENKRIIKTPEPTTIEFQQLFRDILDKVSARDRRYIIVIDNLDRLPADEAVAMWTTIRSFFLGTAGKPEERAKLPGILLPVDEGSIQKLFPAGDDQAAAVRSFMDKTFDLTFHVPPPVLSDWHDYFARQLHAALGNAGDEQTGLQISRIFGRTLADGDAVTPRTLNKLVNAIAALWMQRGASQVPLVSIGYYVVHRSRIEKDIYEVLAEPRFDMADVDADWQRSLAALHFGVAPDKALGVLLRNRLAHALDGALPEPIQEASTITGFERVLIKAVDDIPDRGSLVNAISALSGAKLEMTPWISFVWKRLRSKFVALEDQMGDQAAALRALLQNCPSKDRPLFLQDAAAAVTKLSSRGELPTKAPEMISAFVDALWSGATEAGIELPQVSVGQNPGHYLDIASALADRYGVDNALVTTARGEELAKTLVVELQNNTESRLLLRTKLVLKWAPSENLSAILDTAQHVMRTFTGDSEPTEAAAYILGKYWNRDEQSRAGLADLLHSGVIPVRLQEALSAQRMQTAAELIALHFVGNHIADDPSNGTGWGSVIEVDPAFPTRINAALSEFADDYPFASIAKQARDRHSSRDLVRPLIAQRLEMDSLGVLPTQAMVQNAEPFFEFLDERDQGRLAGKLAEERGFWDMLGAEELSPAALVLYRLLIAAEGVSSEDRNRARKLLLRQLQSVFSAIWQDAIRADGEPLRIAHELQLTQKKPIGVGDNLFAALSGLSGELVMTEHRPFGSAWFSATRLLTSSSRRTLMRNLRDQLLSGQPIPDLAGLIGTGGPTVLEDGDFAARADESVRHILMPLLLQPVCHPLVRSMGDTFAGLVARSTKDTREHVAMSLRDWRRTADNPKELENLSQILRLAR